MERLVGKKAPDFHVEAVSGDGDSFFEAELQDYTGKWLMLLFYPMDFTFVCPTELTAFSKAYEAFAELDTEILGVSTDSKYSHQAWIRSSLGELRFPLAADKLMKLSCDYGVLEEEAGTALRGLFLIDPEQTVRYAAVHDSSIGRSVDETLRVLTALKTGGLCPANWKAGEKLIDPDAVDILQKSGEASVKIYTLPDCGYCQQVKEFLRSKGVDYVEIDLSNSRAGQDFMDARGYTGTPVTVVKGQEVVGLNLKRLGELI